MRKSIVNLICIICAVFAVLASAPLAQASDFDGITSIVEDLLQDGYAETKATSIEEAKAICHEAQVYTDAVSVLSETRGVSAKYVPNSNTLKITLKSPQSEPFHEDELSSLYEDAGVSVREINDFIAAKLSYDYEAVKDDAGLSLGSTSATAKGAFSTGKAVCQGYANLFALLAEHAGIHNVKIRGRIKNVYHIMNVVRTDQGEFIAVDVTSNDSSKKNWSLISFDDYCEKINFIPEVDVETAFSLKYPS